MKLIQQYFPDLNKLQIEQFGQLGDLYAEWNAQINVISRKDIENLYEKHILHSLAIAKVLSFKPGTNIIDLGTGGGFPGIPLAILFPETQFLLIDGTRKKMKVVQAVADATQLSNVTAKQLRAEECKEKVDFVVCRAVATIDKLWSWTVPLLKSEQKNALPNGLIAMKGGDVEKELGLLPKHEYSEIFPIQDYFDRPVFDEKYVVYVQG